MNEDLNSGAIKRLLNEIAELCDHASLTGSLSGGSRRTAIRYNTILEKLTTDGLVPSGLFGRISEDSDYAEIGVDARMLASYLGGDKGKDRSDRGDSTDRNVLVRLAPFVNKEELGLLIREHARQGGALDMNTVSQLAPFLGSDVLGSLLREHLSKTTPSHDVPPPASASATPAAPPETRKPVFDLAIPSTAIQPSMDKPESIEELLDLLKSPYLSDEERSAAVERLKLATGRG